MSSHSMQAWRAVGISLGVALLLSCIGWLSVNQPAFAASDQPAEVEATIGVNTTNPAIIDDNFCSIIEAIDNANTDLVIHDDCFQGNGNDVISLPSDAAIIFTTTHNTVDGSNALPVITSTITIIGNGATLIREPNLSPFFRFFNVIVDGDLSLVDLGLRNGRAAVGGTNPLLLGGGAILNQGRLTVTDSNLSYNRASFGGAIYSDPVGGFLTLSNTTFTFNEADLNGGAVYNFGPGVINGGLMRLNKATVSGGALVHSSDMLTVTNALFRDNTTAGAGAAIAAYASVTDSHLWISATNIISNVAALNGGGVANSASEGMTSFVEIKGSILTANRAESTVTNDGKGGGIVNGWLLDNGGGVAELHLIQSSVTDNVAQDGGGVANVDVIGYVSRTAEIFIIQSTLAHNTAIGIGIQRAAGGGLYNSNGEATVANSTISDNEAIGNDSAQGGRGGGIGNISRGITTTLRLLNSTVAFNGARHAGGGVTVMRQDPDSPSDMVIGNSLIVSNDLSVTQTITTAALLASVASPQVLPGTESCSIENGSVSSLGGNIEDGTTCNLNPAIDLRDTSVELGVLANNGGPTLTHLIAEDSPAVDGGVDAVCDSAPVSGVDQRGITRPQAAGCDVGAVELESTEPAIRTLLFPQLYLNHSFD